MDGVAPLRVHGGARLDRGRGKLSAGFTLGGCHMWITSRDVWAVEVSATSAVVMWLVGAWLLYCKGTLLHTQAACAPATSSALLSWRLVVAPAWSWSQSRWSAPLPGQRSTHLPGSTTARVAKAYTFCNLQCACAARRTTVSALLRVNSDP